MKSTIIIGIEEHIQSHYQRTILYEGKFEEILPCFEALWRFCELVKIILLLSQTGMMSKIYGQHQHEWFQRMVKGYGVKKMKLTNGVSIINYILSD